MSEYVYFIQAVKSGLIKIGRTQHVLSRLAQLQTGAQENLQVLGVVNGDVALENSLHEELSDYRTHGEWFIASPEVISRIEALVVERGVGELTSHKVRADIYTVQASNWLKYLLSREVERVGISAYRGYEAVGKLINLPRGSVENILRQRIGQIPMADYEVIRVAVAAEYRKHITELQAEIAATIGTHHASHQICEAEALLAKARAILSRDGGDT